MVIRKDSKWKIHEMEESTIAPIIGSIFAPILIIGILAWILDIKRKWQFIYFICISSLIVWLSLYSWIKWYISASKLNKVKNFKKSWWWIIKKVKITSIEPYTTHSDDWQTKSYRYLESKEWDTIYCSNDFKVSEFITTSNELTTITQSELDKLQPGWRIRVTYKKSEHKPKIYWVKSNWHTIMIWDTITVYIDPDDQNNYWMDTDFLLKK